MNTMDTLQKNCEDIAQTITNPEEWAKEYAEDREMSPDDVTAYDWLEDVLDIEYIVSSDKQYKSAKVLVAFGGPNIWVNFDDMTVDGYWGGDKVSVPFTDNMHIDEALEELYLS